MAATSRTRTLIQEKGETVVRFDAHQRIQHFLMLSSFLVLAFTGVPQKFNDWAVSQWWINTLGGIDNVRTAHRYAAFVMVFDCFYHMTYVLYSTLALKRPFPFWMIPSLKDVRDFLTDIRYFMGLSKKEPKFDRFSYREKFDYWAIFWGMPIMAVSGFILMFPVFFTRFLPGSSVPIALIAHSDEAILAISWIFIVHFYFAHFTPRVFPVNTSIFTGKVPIGRYREEHPLEYHKMVNDVNAPAPVAGSRRSDRAPAAAIQYITGEGVSDVTGVITDNRNQ